MHYHIIWSQGFIEHRTKGKFSMLNEARDTCDSLLRNDIAVWANPDICFDIECEPFSQNEIEEVL